MRPRPSQRENRPASPTRLTALGCLCATLLLSSACAAEPPAPEPAPSADQVIAELGAQKVLAQKVWTIEKAYLEKRKQADPKAKFRPGERAEIRKQIALKELEMALLDEHVAKNALTVSAEESAARLEQFKASLANTKQTYQEFLASLGKSDADFQRTSNSILAIEKQLKLAISDADVAAFFEKNKDSIPLRRCSHILIAFEGAQRATTTRTKAEAIKEAQAIQEQLAKGGDFEKIAREKSDCPTKEKGGDLEFLSRKGPMVEPVTKALYELKEAGHTSGIVESDFGLHLLKLTEFRGLDQYKDRIREGLVRERFDGFIQQFRREKMKEVKLNQPLLELDP